MEFTSLNNIKSRLPQVLNSIASEIGVELYKSIEEQFVKETTPTQLAVRTGQLLRSYKVGDSNNVFQTKQSNGKLDITYYSKLPYASLHEYGGKIQSKGKLHKFFWAMYYKFKQEKYKWMAFSAKKNGYITIPKRPYIAKALEDFQINKLPTIIQNKMKTLWPG